MAYSTIADVVLLIHFGIVLFVVGGLLLIVLGNILKWCWVNTWWFRAFHLFTIAVVVAESWLGIECPLTSLENWLRMQAGQDFSPVAGQAGFIQYWVHQLMFFTAPGWVFAAAYSAFACMVIVAWWRWPPGHIRGHQPGKNKPAP
jgi:hypothetical protein